MTRAVSMEETISHVRKRHELDSSTLTEPARTGSAPEPEQRSHFWFRMKIAYPRPTSKRDWAAIYPSLGQAVDRLR